MPARKRKHSGEARDDLDWYVEPRWCTAALIEHTFRSIQPSKPIWDPFCGQGNVVAELLEWGYCAYGTDLVDRGARNFRGCGAYDTPGWFERSIICNPPYKIAEDVCRHFIGFSRMEYLAILCRLDFLASQRRYSLFDDHPPACVLILSRRPSMPPGWLAVAAKGGQHDYCWIIWQRDNRRPTEMRWADPENY